MMVPGARFELAKAQLLRLVGVPISIATRAGASCKDSNPRPPIYRNGALPTELTKRSGWQGRDRTCDATVNSRLLYQLSYMPNACSQFRGSRVRNVVWVAGFEPAASAFQARPSTGLTIHPEMVGRGRMAFMVRQLYFN
jgi:hypothetical protein